MNSTEHSSVLNVTLDINPNFWFHFSPIDEKDELTIGVKIWVCDSLLAIDNSISGSETAIYTFFGDVRGVMTDDMYPYMYYDSQLTLNAPFTVHIGFPSSHYFSNSQPAPIEYYVKEDQRWVMFSIDFLGGRYAQTLVCNFENPTAQAHSEFNVFMVGAFFTLSITFIFEAVRELASAHVKRNADEEEQAHTNKTPSGNGDNDEINQLICRVNDDFEKSIFRIYRSGKIDLRYYFKIATALFYMFIIGVTGYLLYIIANAMPFLEQPSSQLAVAVSLTAAFIAFANFSVSIQNFLKPETTYDILVDYNYKMFKEKEGVTEANAALLKSLIILKSKQPELNLTQFVKPPITNEKLFEWLYK